MKAPLILNCLTMFADILVLGYRFDQCSIFIKHLKNLKKIYVLSM